MVRVVVPAEYDDGMGKDKPEGSGAREAAERFPSLSLQVIDAAAEKSQHSASLSSEMATTATRAAEEAQKAVETARQTIAEGSDRGLPGAAGRGGGAREGGAPQPGRARARDQRRRRRGPPAPRRGLPTAHQPRARAARADNQPRGDGGGAAGSGAARPSRDAFRFHQRVADHP